MTENKIYSLPQEVIAEIKRLQYKTRRLVEDGISGNYRSAFRGRGIEFEEVREYVPGDDVRAIDWKVTARSNQPFIKLFREERELTVLIAVDVSRSTITGTQGALREKLIAQVGAVLTLLAQKNNDRVGLVTFSDVIEHYHPPRKARHAIPRILREVLGAKERHRRTNLEPLVSFLGSVLKRHAVVFIISDFFDMQIAGQLRSLCRRHEVVSVLITDPAETQLPKVGLVELEDPETGERQLIDSSSAMFRRDYELAANLARKELLEALSKEGVDVVELRTDKPFMRNLRKFLSGKSVGRARQRILLDD